MTLHWPSCPKCKQSATGVYAGWICCIRCLAWKWTGEHRQFCVLAPMRVAKA